MDGSGCLRHEFEKHASVPNQFHCSICGMAWNSAAYLRKHMARRHKVRVDGSPLRILKSSRKIVRELIEKRCKADPDYVQIKSEQLAPQEISDLNERDDDDWQVDQQIDDDELGSECLPIRKRVNGMVQCRFCDKGFNYNCLIRNTIS